MTAPEIPDEFEEDATPTFAAPDDYDPDMLAKGGPTMTDVHVPAALKGKNPNSPEYVEEMMRAAKEHLPPWLYKELHKRAMPRAGGRAAHRAVDSGPVAKIAANGIVTQDLSTLTNDDLSHLHDKLHDWHGALQGGQTDTNIVKAHQVVASEMSARNMACPPDDELTKMARTLLAKSVSYPDCLPTEIVIQPAMVTAQGDGNGNGRRELVLRGERQGNSMLLKARSLWQPLMQAARKSGEDVSLTTDVREGSEPLYDLVLRRRGALRPTMRDLPELQGETMPLSFGANVTAFTLLKADQAMQMVTGVVFEPNVVDTQGDMVDAGEIQKACYDFLEAYRARQTKLRLSHDRDLGDTEAVLVENYIAPQALTIGGQPVKKGAWVQTWHLKSVPLWKAACDGTLTGFSFGGFGKRLPIIEKSDDTQKLPETMRMAIHRQADGRVASIDGPGYRLKPVREMGELVGIDVERL